MQGLRAKYPAILLISKKKNARLFFAFKGQKVPRCPTCVPARFWRSRGVSGTLKFAFAAVAAAVALGVSRAGGAAGVHSRERCGIAWREREIAACGLDSLVGFANVIFSAVFDKDVPGAKKFKRDFVPGALFAEGFDPFVMERSGSLVVFAVGIDKFDFSARQIGFEIDGSDKGCDHNAFVGGGNGEEDGDAFVRPFLIFSRDRQCDIGIAAVAPVGRQAFANAVGAFGDEKKLEILAGFHHLPAFFPPFVGFFEKKVAGQADVNLRSRGHFVGFVAGTRHGEIKICFYLINLGAVVPARFVEIIHVAVFATFGKLATAVPWIPGEHLALFADQEGDLCEGVEIIVLCGDEGGGGFCQGDLGIGAVER